MQHGGSLYVGRPTRRHRVATVTPSRHRCPLHVTESTSRHRVTSGRGGDDRSRSTSICG